jgi:hypothetical protein
MKGRIINNFTDFGNRSWKNRLDGGKADNKTPEDFDPDDIAIGTAVEREHTSNPDIATEIAIDHLTQKDDYYDKLIASGIADDQGVIDMYDDLKGQSDRDKAENDITTFMEEEDYNGPDDFDEDDFDEDELGTDKTDYDENDELIFDEEDEPKNKKRIMEKSIKNYKLFLKNEAAAQEPLPASDPGPGRKYSKENKYKFQIDYEKDIVDKLIEYSFSYFVPEGEKEISKPSKDTHFIIIDILNLTYSVLDHDSPEIKNIDKSKLKHLLEGL